MTGGTTVDRAPLDVFSDIPWLGAGLIVALGVSVVTGGPVARRLGTPVPVGWLLIASLGAIAAATLTPLGGEPQSTGCDLSRLGPASLRDLRRISDTSLNVVLFMPLGAATALIPSRRRQAIAIVLAGLLPVMVETVQLYAPALSRGCQSADVADNLTGLLVGVVGTGVGRSLLHRRRTLQRYVRVRERTE